MGFWINSIQVEANDNVPKVCCMQADMAYCVVVIYVGSGGGQTYPFTGVKVACPSPHQ